MFNKCTIYNIHRYTYTYPDTSALCSKYIINMIFIIYRILLSIMIILYRCTLGV